MKSKDYEFLLEIIEEIEKASHNEIPFYAYGDNEAACRMSDQLAEVNSKTHNLLNLLKQYANRTEF